MDGQYAVLSPWAEVDPIQFRGITAPRLRDLADKKIGLFASSKPISKRILTAVEAQLKKRFPTVETSWYIGEGSWAVLQLETQNREKYKDWIKGVDAVIAAVGDWGGCTKYLVYETISIEDMKKPAVALCNEGFALDAGSSASVKGMPGVRIVFETIPPHSTVTEEIEAGVSAVMNDIIAALTSPLTADEESPKQREAKESSRIVFKGNVDEVNLFFYKRGWTDGLPIIPPTEEAVAKMLGGTNLNADDVVARIIPRLGKATVEKIAINAVMAGALPTYMPVLIAGVIAAYGPESRKGPWQLGSTLSPAPFWIINGPIRNDLRVNSGTGFLSPGNIANAAIGRAMGLIVKNIGGVRKGIEDMAVIGNPLKYTAVIAENEEESPWEPLHVEQGLQKEDGAITVASGNSFRIVTTNGTDDRGILSAVVQSMFGEIASFYLLLPPQYARILAAKGWTKKKIEDFVLTAVPESHDSGAPPTLLARGVQIVVAGGPGPCWMGLLKAFGGKGVTQKVELPENWDRLVATYRDVVPTYANY